MRVVLSALSVAVAALACVPAGAATFQSLYSFQGNTDGDGPYGRLSFGPDGALYGTTLQGGANAHGTVFRFDPALHTVTALHAFSGALDGGTPTAGVVFDKKGNLYGTTETGGSTTHCGNGCGTVFKVNAGLGKFTTVYRFTGLGDGFVPNAQLVIDQQGLLYGTTDFGGDTSQNPNGAGTVFRLDPASSLLTTLHALHVSTDGNQPDAGLVFGPGGLLYGSAVGGGAQGNGTLFKVNPATGGFTTFHVFASATDGKSPDAVLTPRKGFLYGTTLSGGPPDGDTNDGTIYKLDTGTGQLTELYVFTNTSSQAPQGIRPGPGVVFGSNGKLVGTANQGGAAGAGTVFQLDPKGGTFRPIHTFAISDGAYPIGGLVLGADGALYGVTAGGGSGHGTIYKIVP